jgi:hypothetical protein
MPHPIFSFPSQGRGNNPLSSPQQAAGYSAGGFDKKITLLEIINVLGIAFFLPFLLIQPVDQLIIIVIGWKLIPVTIIHTVILLWEVWASVEIISSIMQLKVLEKLLSITILSIVWILITGMLWR